MLDKRLKEILLDFRDEWSNELDRSVEKLKSAFEEAGYKRSTDFMEGGGYLDLAESPVVQWLNDNGWYHSPLIDFQMNRIESGELMTGQEWEEKALKEGWRRYKIMPTIEDLLKDQELKALIKAENLLGMLNVSERDKNELE